MNIRQLQEHVNELRSAQGWHNTSLEYRALFLMTEIGEVIQEIIKLSNIDEKSQSAKREEIKERLGMEIYDVIWNLCDLANIAGVDLEAAFDKKIEINRARKWQTDV
jgi:NTP pyrophosphatase (non-canonical NTP hydrolase)